MGIFRCIKQYRLLWRSTNEKCLRRNAQQCICGKTFFVPSFDVNSSSSATIEILPKYSAKLDDSHLENLWASGSASFKQITQQSDPATVTSSYDYYKIKYPDFNSFKAQYEASSSVYNIHNDPVVFSQNHAENNTVPSYDNIFYIDSGKRYTFSFESAPNPSVDVMDEIDARLWRSAGPTGDQTGPSSDPTDYPGWTRHIYVKIIKRGTGTSIKGQVDDSYGYIPLLDSIKQDKRIDGITTLKDVCMGDPSFIVGGPLNLQTYVTLMTTPKTTCLA